MRRICSFVLLVVAVSSWACSSLEVGRLEPGSEVKGIPYQLTTSTFMVKVDPPTGSGLKPTYTLNQVIVPDPDHKFWVNASPAFLAKTSLKLTFGQRGELANTVTAVEEQITPIIKALGQFAITALGTAAKMAVMDQKGDMELAIKQVKDTSQIIRPPKESPEDPTLIELSVRDNMVERMRNLNAQSPQDLSERFYPETETEVGWLISATKEITRQLEKQSADYTNTLKACTVDTDCKGFLDERKAKIGDMVNESTSEGLDRLDVVLVALLADKSKPAAEQARLTSIHRLMKPVLKEANSLRSTRQSLRERKKIIDQFIGMSENEWRHRRALELEAKIQKEEHALIFSGTTVEPPSLIALRKQLALCIGATTEAEREAALRVLLVQLGSASTQILSQSQREVPLMKEYQRARQELEAVLAILKVKRDALKPEKTSSQLVSREVTPALIWWAEAQRSDPDTVRTRLLTNGPNPLPDFVVVIERGMTP